MTALSVVLFALSCMVLLVWSSRHFLIALERRKALVLTEQCPGPPEPAPRISVVVAAKDEQDNIEGCVRTMLDQDYPDFEVVVCNDRSEDLTGQIVQAISDENPLLRLVNIEHLPEGWCGKNNAMQTGIASTDGEWICMVDADCRQTSRRTLSTAMQYASDNNADLLSVLPNLEMKGFWENAIQPVCSGVMMIWFYPDKVNSADKPNAYANGAFMLIKRSAYEAIGTHESVKDQVNEDMHMAARIKQAGLRLQVIRNQGLYLVRMYTSLRQIVRGWSRIFYGTFGTVKRLTVSLLVLALMGVVPYVAAAVGFVALAWPLASSWHLACGTAGTLAIAMQISVIYRFYALIGARKWLAWTYVIGCAAAMLSVAIALTKLRKGAVLTWRGTSYSSQGD